MRDYRPRIVDSELERRLGSAGAVIVEGPRACGKTATARHVAASEALLDINENMRSAVTVNPALVLEGEVPRLIDEWQLAPQIWNLVRRVVDDRRARGQFVLTGSAIPTDDITRHSGAGRFSRLRMRPMSLFEAGQSTGAISLARLLDGEPMKGVRVDSSVAEIANAIAVGGWPGLHDLPTEEALPSIRDYVDEIARVDLSRVDERPRDPVKVRRLLTSLARNVATHAAATTLAADTGGSDGALDDDTVREYLHALERLMVVEDQPAWAPHLRSKRRLRQAAKRHFVDPSLAVGALRATPQRLLEDLPLFGFLFESLVVRDLRVYAQAAAADVYQYRDNKGMEVDAIVEGLDGRWMAIEVKLDSSRIHEAAANLLRFSEQVDSERCGKPSALCVVICGEYGFTLEDGVHVIPIGALGP